MKLHWLAILTIMAGSLGLAAEPKLPAKKDFHLFLLIGQSNMAGRGKLDEQSKIAHPRVWVLGKDAAWKPAADPLHYDKPAAGAGLGKSFGERVAEKLPNIQVGLIPAACGGAPIAVWAPGAKHSQTQSNPYDDALARAKRAAREGTLKAILWHQGESDCTADLAPVHEQKLRELITRLRADLGAPELPFIIGQLGRFSPKWNEPTQEVDHAQRKVSQSLKNVYFVSSDKLVSGGDGLHFDTASLRTLGERYADVYLKAR